MERLSITPRPDWQTQVESLGLCYHTPNGKPYWDESTCYRFEAREIDEIVTASNDIEKMCLEVVQNVVEYQRYSELNIPDFAWELIEASWHRRDQNLFGRFDLCYDGIHPPKLLEYNADTPITLVEASAVQKHWLQQVRPESAQFNSIHEKLVDAWPQFGPGPIHLATRMHNKEYFANIAYMAQTITEAGLVPKLQTIDKLVWNDRCFVDAENTPVTTLFKLYPWEWLLKGAYGNYASQCDITFIEPIWKMILGNKGLLVLLWELFPGHPNLLPAYFDSKKIQGDYFEKPLLGRRGENVSLYSAQGNIISKDPINQDPFIYQQAHLLPNIDGHYPVIGSWLVQGQTAGIGVREDTTPITQNFSPFVPHFVGE